MRIALPVCMVLASATAHANTGDCPPLRQLARALAEEATTDEAARFEVALAPLVAKHCSADARRNGRAWSVEASSCVAKGIGGACLDKASPGLRAALAADAAAAFPYGVVGVGMSLEIHGPLTLEAPSRALDAIAAFLVANPTMRIEVEGFSDEVGGPARRRAQSQQRADDVRAYLVAAGAAAANVTATGRGLDRPRSPGRMAHFLVKGGRFGSATPLPASASAADRAKALYRDGEVAYNLGNFAEAIAKFEASYREVASPALLFNIGQAFKQKGDKATAIHFFERFVRDSPSPTQVARVQQMIDELRKTP